LFLLQHHNLLDVLLLVLNLEKKNLLKPTTRRCRRKRSLTIRTNLLSRHRQRREVAPAMLQGSQQNVTEWTLLSKTVQMMMKMTIVVDHHMNLLDEHLYVNAHDHVILHRENVLDHMMMTKKMMICDLLHSLNRFHVVLATEHEYAKVQGHEIVQMLKMNLDVMHLRWAFLLARSRRRRQRSRT